MASGKALSDPRSLTAPGTTDLRRPKLNIPKKMNFKTVMPKSAVKPLTLASLMPQHFKKLGIKF